jgi:REP element-mobilizing transposase RayT
MSRPLRIEYRGAIYHITSRGNEKKPIFLEKQDREVFLDILKKVNKRYNFLCHTYCLMDNHYHLVIETPEGNLSQGMRQLNGVYTQTFNKKHQSFGHVFQGRYKAILIQKESHLLEVSRYVVLNPVRAKLVESPEEWIYSSFLETSGLQEPHPSLTTDWILAQFGEKKTLAQKRYREFVQEGIEKGSIFTKTKGQILLGEDDFVKQFTAYLKKQEDMKEIPKSQRYLNRPSLDSLFEEEIVKNKQKRDNKIYEAVDKYGYSQKEIADHLKLHYSTISRLLNIQRE